MGQKFCRNPTSKFSFYEENGFKKYSYITYCSICVPYEPLFPILCFAFFLKNSKIECDPHFWREEIFLKIEESSLFRYPLGRKFYPYPIQTTYMEQSFLK